jgi:hypothetical protein
LELAVLLGVVEPALELHERVGIEVVRVQGSRGDRHDAEATG